MWKEILILHEFYLNRHLSPLRTLRQAYYVNFVPYIWRKRSPVRTWRQAHWVQFVQYALRKRIVLSPLRT